MRWHIYEAVLLGDGVKRPTTFVDLDPEQDRGSSTTLVSQALAQALLVPIALFIMPLTAASNVPPKVRQSLIGHFASLSLIEVHQ